MAFISKEISEQDKMTGIESCSESESLSDTDVSMEYEEELPERVFLSGLDGELQLSLGVLCNGQPCDAHSMQDPITGKQVVRFVALGPGELQFVVNNINLRPAVMVDFYRAKLRCGDDWQAALVQGRRVNHVNYLPGGECILISRDENTRRTIVLEPLSDSQMGVRTMWKLHVSPACSARWETIWSPPGLKVSSWVVCEQDLYHWDSGNVTLSVLSHVMATPLVLRVRDGSSLASVQSMLHAHLNVAPSDQLLADCHGEFIGSNFRAGKSEESAMRLYMCNKRARCNGPFLWLFVENRCSSVFHTPSPVCCEPSTTIRDLVEKVSVMFVKEEKGAFARQYALFIGPEPLCPKSSVAEYGLKSLSQLSFKEFLPLHLNLQSHWGIRKFRTNPLYKVAAVKEGLEGRIGNIFHKDFNGLYYNGLLLDDSSDLSAVRNGSTLILRENGSMQVTVCVKALNGGDHEVVFRAYPSDTMSTLKERLLFYMKRRSELRSLLERMPYRKLFLKGARLKDHATLQTLDIQCGEAIVCQDEIGPVRIFIQLMRKNEVFAVLCKPNSKVHRLKTTIQQRTGVRAGKLRLYFNGEILSGSTLAQCGLKHNDMIQVSEEQCGGAYMICDEEMQDKDDDEKAVATTSAASNTVLSKIVTGRPECRSTLLHPLLDLGNLELEFEICIDSNRA